MTPEDREIAFKKFWGNDKPKTPGIIIGWLRSLRYIRRERRGIVWREALKGLPEDVRQYLREWREKLRGGP